MPRFVEKYRRIHVESGRSETCEFNESHAYEAQTIFGDGVKNPKGLPLLEALMLVNKWNQYPIRFVYVVEDV